jgi:hypothetical protein
VSVRLLIGSRKQCVLASESFFASSPRQARWARWKRSILTHVFLSPPMPLQLLGQPGLPALHLSHRLLCLPMNQPITPTIHSNSYLFPLPSAMWEWPTWMPTKGKSGRNKYVALGFHILGKYL